VLIVCEGEETEPRYFRAHCRDRRLTAAEVHVCGPGVDPSQVVEYAKRRRDGARRDREPYDQVWCVFDRDGHTHFEDARERARALKFQVAFSNPCFELWYLLHFRYSTGHIERDDAAGELRHQHIEGYGKSSDVYDLLCAHQPAALENAGRLREYHRQALNDETHNPSTSVDQLVNRLNELADRQ
jgi:hypothetical protein